MQEPLGHSSLLSTQICTRVAISKLKAVHADAATHPGGKLAGSRQAAKPGPEGVGSAPGTAEGAEAANSPEKQ